MRRRFWLILSILSVALAACAGPPGPTVTPTVTATAQPPQPTATETDPASGAMPTGKADDQSAGELTAATSTPLPTATPLPTPSATPEALRPLSVTVDVTTEAGLLDTGRMLNVSAGGYAPMANPNWLPGIYDKLHAIDVEMIRLDHLLDEAFYSVVWRDGSGLRYDFSRLDRVVVPILQQGMEPLMCLSYKPEALDPRGQSKAPPSDLEEWQDVVRTFVAHYAELGYTGLTWEVWNEPDHTFFFQGGPEQYVALYAATAEAVKAVDPTARVGGAADSSVTSPGGKLGPLLGHIAAHPEVALDFVSYHDYSDPDGDGLGPYTLTWNVGVIEQMVAEAGLAPREILVTEWNLTPSMTTGAGAPPDTNVGAAAMAVKLYDLLAHPAIRRAFFFAPIDGYAPRERFSGDLGLLTVNGQRKAAYNLFEMISRLGNRRLATTVDGENTDAHNSYALATRDDGDTVAVLIWNDWEEGRTLDLSVTGLGAGQGWAVTRTLIDAEHANLYHDYARGLRGYSVSPSEALLPIDWGRTVTGDALTERYALPPHSVMLVTLTPDGAAAGAPPPIGAPDQPDNVAAGQPVAASSNLEGAGWGADRLVDEVVHSLPDTLGWSSAVHDMPERTEWVQVDLGEPTPVDTVRLYPRDDLYHEGAGFPIDFTIQGATTPDAWVDLVSVADYDPGEPARQVQVFAFEPGTYRTIRVTAMRLGAIDDGVYALQFAEITVGNSSSAP